MFYQKGLILPSEHRILIYIISKRSLVIELKNTTIASDLHMSRTTVIKGINQLVRRGMIESAFDSQVVSKSKGRVYRIAPPKSWKKYRSIIM